MSIFWICGERFLVECQLLTEAFERARYISHPGAVIALFHYKEELDPDKIPQFGLIAEEVEKVNPGLVVRDGDGKVSTVRYEAVNAMLLNEFLKEHRAVQNLKGIVETQMATIAKQEKEFQAKFPSKTKLFNRNSRNSRSRSSSFLPACKR